MSWNDYRFNGLRTTIEDHRDMWIPIRDIAKQQGAEVATANAIGRIEGMETALRILETWVKAIQEEERDGGLR